MWTTIVTFLVSKVPGISALSTAISSGKITIKGVVFTCLAAALVVYIIALKWNISSLENTVQEQIVIIEAKDIEINNAKAKISVMETEDTLQSLETKNINDMLKACYQSLDARNTSLAEIEAIMSAKPIPEPTMPKGEMTYEVITTYQNDLGLSFLNRQLDAIE